MEERKKFYIGPLAHFGAKLFKVNEDIEDKAVFGSEWRALIRMFYELLPDHTQGNTHYYILDKGEDALTIETKYDFFIYCSHFEHGNMPDLTKLHAVIHQFSFFLDIWTWQGGYLEYLNMHDEKLVVRFPDIGEKVGKWLLKYSEPSEGYQKSCPLRGLNPDVANTILYEPIIIGPNNKAEKDEKDEE